MFPRTVLSTKNFWNQSKKKKNSLYIGYDLHYVQPSHNRTHTIQRLIMIA